MAPGEMASVHPAPEAFYVGEDPAKLALVRVAYSISPVPNGCTRDLACPEGLEPPTYGLEGRCSIQLSYGQMVERPTERAFVDSMVGAIGFEPTTLWSQTRCATRLRYAPTSLLFYLVAGLKFECLYLLCRVTPEGVVRLQLDTYRWRSHAT